MISAEERRKLWLEFVGGEVNLATTRLEELSLIKVHDLENTIRYMMRRGRFANCEQEAYTIAYEIRHEALRLLTQRRKRETGPLPQMIRVF